MVIAIIGILVALLLPAIQAAREAARRSQCESNLHNASLAGVELRSDQEDVFPNGMNCPTSEATTGTGVSNISTFQHNWIIDVLPYMEEQGLHDAFDLTVKINDPTVNSRNYIGAARLYLLCCARATHSTKYCTKAHLDRTTTGIMHVVTMRRIAAEGSSTAPVRRRR